jgi:hypothetical protein
VHDVNILDQLLIELGAIYIMDRGYLDFARLYKIHRASAFFVTRTKRNFSRSRLYSQSVDFEKEPIYQALSNVSYTNQEDKLSNQLNLFNQPWDGCDSVCIVKKRHAEEGCLKSAEFCG